MLPGAATHTSRYRMKMHLGVFSIIALVSIASCSDPATSPLTPPEESLARRTEPTRMYDLGTLGGTTSVAFDINDKGVVVGMSETSDGTVHPFRWTKESGMKQLESLSGSSYLVGINNKGFIAGVSSDPDGIGHLVMWDPNGKIIDLGVPAGEFHPKDINNHNLIIGEYFPDGYEYEPSVFYWTPKLGFGRYPWIFDLLRVVGVNDRGDVFGAHCCGKAGEDLFGVFLLPQGKEFVDLGAGIANFESWPSDMNDRRVIVGYTVSEEPNISGGFRWHPKEGFEILENLGPSAISDRGEIVGTTRYPDGTPTAFYWAKEVGVVAIGPGQPYAINERSQIAGSSSFFTGASHATLWVGTRGFPTPIDGSSSRASGDDASALGKCLADNEAGRSKASLVECLAIANR
jgi:probable HAF family extracellular repeat protein